MANDGLLNAAFAKAAANSKGQIVFASRSSKDYTDELGFELPRARNPIYDFTVTLPSGQKFRSVAYTLVVDGAKRPATRAEALGRGLGAQAGKLFALNPFLLVFDFTANQLLAVSAATLFGAFAKEADGLAKAATASFSLSPNFKNHTISMYGDLPSAAIWHAKLDESFDANVLMEGLRKMESETSAQANNIPVIVKAIEARLANTAPIQTLALPLPEGSEAIAIPVPDSAEPTIQIDERVRRMVRTAIRSAVAVVLVGPPGTGKTALLREMFREFAHDPTTIGLQNFQPPLWATPDESWTVRELVGGDTIVANAIQFQPGWVLKAIADDAWLVLDEVNRADMDRIFGGLLTWLSGGSVTIGMASKQVGAPKIELGWDAQTASSTEGIDSSGELVGMNGRVRYSAGTGWRLLGTYNALDAQRVFRFGAALGRRFARVPIPAPDAELFGAALEQQAPQMPEELRDAIEGLYAAHFAKEETHLGPAIFLSMCKYILATAAPNAETFSEAYVVHAGTWLAHLERRDFDELGARIIAGNVLTSNEWSWIMEMIRSLA